jgi:Protein of unknown function (DUF3105)
LTDDVPGRPDQSRKLTKAERKDQARLEREALQRRLASKRRTRSIAIVVGVLVVAAIVAAATLLPSGGDDLPSPNQLLQRATAAADAAGCGDVTTTPPFDPPDQDRTHIGGGDIAGPPLSAYPTTPPASGPHADVPLPAGVYDSMTLSELYRSIHSLEHGATVVWYDPAAPAGDVARLIEFYDRRLQDAEVGQDRAIVAPYDFPGDAGGILPEGTQLALVSWHRLRTCASVDLAVAFDFTSQYSFPTTAGRDYQGEAPEPGAAI